MLRSAAVALLAGVIAPTREQQAEAAAQAVRDHFGRKRSPQHMNDILDPYFGIKSKGRRGATARAALMAEARREAVKPRGAPSNPFKHDKRRSAFGIAMSSGHSRADAMKLARRVTA